MTTCPQVAAQTTQIGMALAAECPSDSKMATGGNPEPRHPCGLLVAMQAMNINTESGCGEATDPNVALSCNWSPDASMAPGGSAGHSDGGGTCGDMAIRNECGNPDPMCPHRVQ